MNIVTAVLDLDIGSAHTLEVREAVNVAILKQTFVSLTQEEQFVLLVRPIPIMYYT